MNKGRVLFCVNRKRFRFYKITGYIMAISGLVLLTVWPYLFYQMSPEAIHTLFWNVCFLYYPIAYGLIFFMLIYGFVKDILELNMFCIYEKGISPPKKPLKMMFKEYYIPFDEIKEIKFFDKEWPLDYELVLKNGDAVRIKSWYIYKFLDERDYENVDKYMRIALELVRKNAQKKKIK